MQARKFASSISEFGPAEWNRLAGRPDIHSLRHEFLLESERSESVSAASRLETLPPGAVRDSVGKLARRPCRCMKNPIPGANSYSTGAGRKPMSGPDCLTIRNW